MIKRATGTVQLHPAGQPVVGQRDSKSKAEDILIEEILKAAGLESLD